MADISQIKLPDGVTYNIKDPSALHAHQSVTDNNPTLSWGTKSKVATIGSTDIHVTMPSNPNTNTTYTIATGDNNGQIKVTPSSGSAYNVSVKGLGSAAYVNADTSATANTVAKRQGNGYLYATYFNQSSGAETPSTSSYAFYCNSDGFLRKSSMANMRTALGLGSLATLSSVANYVTIAEVSVDNVSIAANNTTQTSNIATTKSGWTAVHIIGVSLQNASSSGTLYSWCVPYQVNMNSSKQVNAQIRNYYTGGAAKIKVIFRILYIK